MKKDTLTILIICLFTLNAYSQTEAVTKKGDTIFIYDNGTWKNKTTVKKTLLIKSSVIATVSVDDFSNKKSYKTAQWSSFGISETRTKMSGYATFYNEGIYAINLIIPTDLGCMSENRSTLKVKLSNGEVVDFIQVSDTDCGSNIFASFIPVSRAVLDSGKLLEPIKESVKTLKEFDWVTIRVEGTKYYLDFVPRVSRRMPNPEQFFRQHLISIDNKL